MVSATIAAEELLQKNPRLVDRIVQLMARHPDWEAFEVAIGRSSGKERARRIFMQMARWPDDIRGGAYDHPTWHYSSRPLLDPRQPATVKSHDATAGSAIEAFALNASVASDPRAPAAERAVALCWIFHLVGDIHQPLHTVDLYSSTSPMGNRGGTRQYVLDPRTRKAVTLHGYWDSTVHRSGKASKTLARASELRTTLPRAQFSELSGVAKADDFRAWAAESYALALPSVYRDDLKSSPAEQEAPALSASYVADSARIAEQRLTLSGYRLADVLIVLIRE